MEQRDLCSSFKAILQKAVTGLIVGGILPNHIRWGLICYFRWRCSQTLDAISTSPSALRSQREMTISARPMVWRSLLDSHKGSICIWGVRVHVCVCTCEKATKKITSCQETFGQMSSLFVSLFSSLFSRSERPFVSVSEIYVASREREKKKASEMVSVSSLRKNQ